MSEKKIFITGGAGYVGSALVPRLLENNFKITVLDLMIYGEDVLDPHPNLQIIKGDIRNQKLLEETIVDHDTVIHLACISNDPSFELNPKLGKSINLDAFRPLVEISKRNKIKRFIYASSSSVYGVKSEPNVTEDFILEPLTDYSKFKADCESILSEYQDDNFTTVTIRPATVCGYARRQRLDLVVNILTNLAFHKREITILGGSQLRPNIHIEDMVDAYITLINAPIDKIAGKIYNAGYLNFSVSEIANMVKEVIGEDVKLVTSPTNDNRSYHISSERIFKDLGFRAKRDIKLAISDLKNAFENKLLVNTLNNEMYFNITRMQNIEIK